MSGLRRRVVGQSQVWFRSPSAQAPHTAEGGVAPSTEGDIGTLADGGIGLQGRAEDTVTASCQTQVSDAAGDVGAGVDLRVAGAEGSLGVAQQPAAPPGGHDLVLVLTGGTGGCTGGIAGLARLPRMAEGLSGVAQAAAEPAGAPRVGQGHPEGEAVGGVSAEPQPKVGEQQEGEAVPVQGQAAPVQRGGEGRCLAVDLGRRKRGERGCWLFAACNIVGAQLKMQQVKALSWRFCGNGK